MPTVAEDLVSWGRRGGWPENHLPGPRGRRRRAQGSLGCRCGVRRALQVSRRREAADAELVRRGSGPPPAVKQALSLPSPARPLVLPRQGCLPAGSC